MRLLITGGCGFLGSNLAAEAIRRGWKPTIFDNLSRVGAELNLQWLRSIGSFHFLHGDIRNPNDTARAVRDAKPKAVFHLSGQVAMTTSIANPRLDFEVNALGTFNLLDALRSHAPDALAIYSSTNKVYGDFAWTPHEERATRHAAVNFPDGFPESVPLDFHSPYGCSKGAADQYMLDAHRIFGQRTVVFRHSSMYGGRQFATYDQGWIGWFCLKAVEAARGASAPFTICGDGKQVRDVLHADDMVNLYFSTIENADDAVGQAFNIGGGMANSLSLLELFAMLEDELRCSLAYTRLPPREGDQKVFVADISKAARLLHWRPCVSKEEGIRKMLAWVAGSTA